MQLPYLTRKSDATPVAAPLWHPNFRNLERLPDIKVVRTTFFVNAAAGAVALMLLAWTGYREYQIYGLNQQIAEAQANIDRNAKQNSEALRLSRLFADEERKLSDALAFIHASVQPAEFLQLLGQSLPREVQLDAVELRLAEGPGLVPQCILHGLVAGTKDQASGSASAYIEVLRAQPQIATVCDTIELKELNPDVKSGQLAFMIVLKFKTEAKKP